MTLQCVCGSRDWLACFPGTEAQARTEGNICWLHPAPEVPMRVWCAACWTVTVGAK